MSRIADLIDKLAPRGIEFRAVADVCTVFSGFAFKSAQFNSEKRGLPLIRIRDVNTGFSDTYYSGDYEDRYLVSDGDILIGMDGDFRATRWSNGTGLLNQRVCRLQDFSPDVAKDFVYYCIQDVLDGIHRGIQGSTVKHLSSRELARAPFPVPPIEVQHEIVRILDRFTVLEKQLEAELRSELRARQAQYEHYREVLITEALGAVKAPMGSLGEFIRGRRFTKQDYVQDGLPSIHYGEIYTTYGTATSSAVTHVRSDMADQLRFALPGDLVIAAVGETVEDVAKAVAWLGDVPVAIHDDAYLFRSDLNPTYVSYAMQTRLFQEQKNKFVSRAKVKRMSSDGLGRIEIPVPPLAEQLRIVSILERFEALIKDISISLPTELRARRQQYKHYRDKLLTFEEAQA